MQPHLLILTPGFPENEADTSCLPAPQSLVRCMRQCRPGVRITVLSFHYPFDAGTYQWHGARVIALAGRNRGHLFRRQLWRRARRTVEELMGSEPVSALLSFWYDECAMVAESASRRKGLPHFCWMLGQDARPGNRYVRSSPIAAHRLFAISDIQADRFESAYGFRPQQVVPNGVEVPEGPVLQERPIDLLGVGSLIPLKRWPLLLDLVQSLIVRHPALHAEIIGGGILEPQLRRMISDRGLEAHLRLAGALSHEAVLQRMELARILVHPSAYEGFSTVCLEALAAGARVVSFEQPMQAACDAWKVVTTREEMEAAIHAMLSSPQTHRRVVPYRMQHTAEAMLRLCLPELSANAEQLTRDRFEG